MGAELNKDDLPPGKVCGVAGWEGEKFRGPGVRTGPGPNVVKMVFGS